MAFCGGGSQPFVSGGIKRVYARRNALGGPARQALRPGCEELAARIRRKCRRRKRGPRPKIATVERREARLPPAEVGLVPNSGKPEFVREAGTPLGAWPATLLRACRVPLHPGACRRSAHPSIGVDCARPGRKCVAGMNRAV